MTRLRRLLLVALVTSFMLMLRRLVDKRGSAVRTAEYYTQSYTMAALHTATDSTVQHEYTDNERYKPLARAHVPLSDDIQTIHYDDVAPPTGSLNDSQYAKLNLTSQLRQTIAFALSHHSCPRYFAANASFPPVKFICRHHSNEPALLTLFSTMYNNPSKVFTFNTTLHMWAGLRGALKPVLFLTPNVHRLEEYLFYVIEQACLLQWDVAIAPNCNHDNFPVLRSMFLAAYGLYESEWYGFANGDILFDKTLLDSLLFLRRYSASMERYSMLLGRRHDTKVKNMSGTGQLKWQLSSSKLHKDYGADYFLTPRDGFPWHEAPPVVVGRPIFDTFIMWYSRSRADVTDVDGTNAILALHLGTDSWRQRNNSGTTGFNPRVIREFNTNASDKSMLNYGRTECLNFMVGHVKSPYQQLYRRRVRVRDKGAKCASYCCPDGHTIIKQDPSSSHPPNIA